MNKLNSKHASLSEVHESVDMTRPRRHWWKRAFGFFGPAYLVSVGYMDPGNWATDLAGGSQFGYSLIWVLLMSNLMALLLQSLSARLGIVRGRDLAQANRELYPRRMNFVLYILAEVAIAATDLAEVLGMAIGIYLLTGLDMIWGVLITILDTFLLLFLQRLGIRKMEAFIIGLVAVIGLSFLVEIILARPDMGEVARGLVPSIPGPGALLIITGIIGATVMPHNLYLHSALVQTRKIGRDEKSIRSALRYMFVDSAIALNLAFLVNAGILVLAAAVFFTTGRTDVAKIEEAHQLLEPLLGSVWAPKLFAIALIASGQSSTITGTLAGQIVMEGYLRLRINPWVRRLVTRLIAIIPALLVILIKGTDDVDALLVFSQVILSLQLGFAIIPLIHIVGDKKKMGSFAIGPIVKFLAWLITGILVYLNAGMVVEKFTPLFTGSGNIWLKILVAGSAATALGLLAYIIIYPFLGRGPGNVQLRPHPEPIPLKQLDPPVYSRIAIALEFGEYDGRLLSHAVGQGSESTQFILIHVVESASAKILGNATDDYETRKDQQQLDVYVSQLEALGKQAKGFLGFRNRAKEIVRIVNEQQADMLVIGAHGHSGLQDFIYGETINTVRHDLRIPVLVVNV